MKTAEEIAAEIIGRMLNLLTNENSKLVNGGKAYLSRLIEEAVNAERTEAERLRKALKFANSELQSKIAELEAELEAVKSLMQDGERRFYEKWKGAEKQVAELEKSIYWVTSKAARAEILELEGELGKAGATLLKEINYRQGAYCNAEEIKAVLALPHIKRITEGKK